MGGPMMPGMPGPGGPPQGGPPPGAGGPPPPGPGGMGGGPPQGLPGGAGMLAGMMGQKPPQRPQIGLAQNAPGVPFQCGTCQFFQGGKCGNPDPALSGRPVQPAMCCDLYDHPGMQKILP